jgi:hypothetical protein
MEEGIQAGYMYIRLNKKKDKNINLLKLRKLVQEKGKGWNVIIEDDDVVFYKKWRNYEDNNK